MTNPGEDAALLSRIKARDPEAMGALYDSYGRRAFGFAYRLVGDYGVAEDLVQDAFLAIWQHADRLDPSRGRLITLLLTIVHHKAIDLVRKQRGRGPVPDPSLLAAELPDTADLAVESLDRDAVREALAELPQEQRRTLQLAYFAGYSHKDIASATRAPLGTVKSRLRIGLQHLRLILREKVKA
jgi:RNA polymerase sigma-70 factor (ECF subfamily)